ncbi:MAG: transporter substrate-binding domain-containing protein [Oleiphilaceae bacterium]|nr:transporter substrate-binding domain-containing protein [Oleiphilaceae bacterium]
MALLCVPLALQAESEVRVAIPQVDPWGYVDEQGNPAGMLMELLQELNKATDLELVYYLRPLSRALLELERGEVDYSIAFESPRVNEIATPVRELVALRVLALGPVQEDARASPRSLDDLTGRPVGYIRGTYYGATFNRHEGIVRVPVQDMRQGLELVHRGRLDAMIGSDMAMAGAYEAMPEEERPALNILFELEPARGMFYRSNQGPDNTTDGLLKNALEQLERSGRLSEIFSPRLRSEGKTPGRWVVEPH